MKIEIRIGDVNDNSPRISWDSNNKLDNYEAEKKRMQDFLIHDHNCVITNVDIYLLYTLNNALTAYYVKDNPKTKNDEDFNALFKLNPDKYHVYEIHEDGKEDSIQTSELDGKTVGTNYFNKLMGYIMDDYYDALTYVEYRTRNKK